MRTSDQLLKLVGGNIRRYRKEKGISLEKLSDLADLNIDFISKVERGLMNISIVSLHKIGKVLGVSPHQFLTPPRNK